MDESLNVVYQALVLDAGWFLNLLLDLYWVLVDFSTQFSCHLDFLVGLGNIILNYQEHSLIGLQ
jgi:hypothetical protein